jgi:glycosyltransferase involved in cell wall biosynthesis
MRIALVAEGAYPFAVGGVSTWCDQLVRGMPDCRWEMVALTVDGTEQRLWPQPSNLDNLRALPLWAPCPSPQHGRPTRGGRATQAERAFLSSYRALVQAMIEPYDLRSGPATVNSSRFLLALRGIYEYTAGGGHLCTGLTSNAGVAQLTEVWSEVHGSQLPVADALEVADMLAHMLRPLAAPPVECNVVHASMNGLCMLVAMAAKWRYGTPVVLSEHGVYLRERYLEYLGSAPGGGGAESTAVPHPVKVALLGFFRSLASASYLIADALAPHSSYNSRWQLVSGADPDRMWTMYNGVSTADFPLAEREPDRPTLVFMGRINPLKDLHTLIRAFPSVRAEVPDAVLRIFGATPAADGEYERSCRRLIAELGLRDSVVLEGEVDSPVSAYHAATVVVLTSISEGFPVAILEAMACGRPVVCTDVGGVAEAVADAGFVVPPRDPRAVARACVTLLVDDELRARMAEAARSRVLRLFTLDESIAAYRRVYDSVTGNGPELAAGAAIAPALVATRPEPSGPSRPPAPRQVPPAARRAPRALGRVRLAHGGLR